MTSTYITESVATSDSDDDDPLTTSPIGGATSATSPIRRSPPTTNTNSYDNLRRGSLKTYNRAPPGGASSTRGINIPINTQGGDVFVGRTITVYIKI